jgi:hypothetical protein
MKLLILRTTMTRRAFRLYREIIHPVASLQIPSKKRDGMPNRLLVQLKLKAYLDRCLFSLIWRRQFLL